MDVRGRYKSGGHGGREATNFLKSLGREEIHYDTGVLARRALARLTETIKQRRVPRAIFPGILAFPVARAERARPSGRTGDNIRVNRRRFVLTRFAFLAAATYPRALERAHVRAERIEIERRLCGGKSAMSAVPGDRAAARF